MTFVAAVAAAADTASIDGHLQLSSSSSVSFALKPTFLWVFIVDWVASLLSVYTCTVYSQSKAQPRRL